MDKIFKTFVGLGILCILVIYIIFGPYLLIKSIGDVVEYHKNKNSVIKLSATVSQIEDSVDSEGGTDYYVYVSYNYNNKHYNDIYWKSP